MENQCAQCASHKDIANRVKVLEEDTKRIDRLTSSIESNLKSIYHQQDIVSNGIENLSTRLRGAVSGNVIRFSIGIVVTIILASIGTLAQLRSNTIAKIDNNTEVIGSYIAEDRATTEYFIKQIDKFADKMDALVEKVK